MFKRQTDNFQFCLLSLSTVNICIDHCISVGGCIASRMQRATICAAPVAPPEELFRCCLTLTLSATLAVPLSLNLLQQPQQIRIVSLAHKQAIADND